MCILNLEISYPQAQTLIQEHQNIFDLLEAGNREELQKALKRHMQKAVHDLRTTSSNREEQSATSTSPAN
jgi:DNA-binding GntR family transcriptional regulator